MNCLISSAKLKPFKVITWHIARRLPRAMFSCDHHRIGWDYNISKQIIVRIDSFCLINHLSHGNHYIHLVLNVWRPYWMGQPKPFLREVFKIKELIFPFEKEWKKESFGWGDILQMHPYHIQVEIQPSSVCGSFVSWSLPQKVDERVLSLPLGMVVCTADVSTRTTSSWWTPT